MYDIKGFQLLQLYLITYTLIMVKVHFYNQLGFHIPYFELSEFLSVFVKSLRRHLHTGYHTR